MGLFDGIISSVIGSVASRAGTEFANLIFDDDDNKKPTAQKPVAANARMDPDTRYSDVDPLRGLENEKVPTGEGFVRGIISTPPRKQDWKDPNLTGELYRRVINDPPASPKLQAEVAKMVSMSDVSSTSRSTKAFQKLLKT